MRLFVLNGTGSFASERKEQAVTDASGAVSLFLAAYAGTRLRACQVRSSRSPHQLPPLGFCSTVHVSAMLIETPALLCVAFRLSSRWIKLGARNHQRQTLIYKLRAKSMSMCKSQTRAVPPAGERQPVSPMGTNKLSHRMPRWASQWASGCKRSILYSFFFPNILSIGLLIELTTFPKKPNT